VSPPGTPVLWLWVTRAILQNDRVEDFSADDAAPPREGRRAGTDLQIHERLFHHQIVTAWASHDEVGFCRTATASECLSPNPSQIPERVEARGRPSSVANKPLLRGSHASRLTDRRLNLDLRALDRRQLTGSLRLHQPGIIGIYQLLARVRIL
jgi:hypothetical protein